MYNNRNYDKLCHGCRMNIYPEVSGDTVEFQLNDFKIGKNAHIQLKQGDIDTATGEIRGNNFLYEQNNDKYRGKRGIF